MNSHTDEYADGYRAGIRAMLTMWEKYYDSDGKIQAEPVRDMEHDAPHRYQVTFVAKYLGSPYGTARFIASHNLSTYEPNVSIKRKTSLGGSEVEVPSYHVLNRDTIEVIFSRTGIYAVTVTA